MSRPLRVMTGGLERLPASASCNVVTEELNRIVALVREACPENAEVCFDFDGRLHVHIDVRKLEDVTLVQAVLPDVGMGMFSNLSLGKTPNRPFSHRISALVA